MLTAPIIRAALGALALLVFGACAPVSKGGAAATAPVAESRLLRVTIPGPSLEGNLAGDEPSGEALVYLPPGYDREQRRRYPLLVLLHGYWSDPGQWESEYLSVKTIVDRAIEAGDADEMIIVMPNGADRLEGGFYVNGAASGDWENYIADDVISFADKTWRTHASRNSRGLAGHSMGGYGALSIAINRPDVFAAIYAMSPCCGDLVGDFALGSPVWNAADAIDSLEEFDASDDFYGRALIALGAAWAPDSQAPLNSRRPVAGGAVDDEVLRLWRANTLVGRIERGGANLRRLNGVAIDVGDRDEFSHILLSTPALSKQLGALGVEHKFEIYPGDHVSGVESQLRAQVLPFFSAHLAD